MKFTSKRKGFSEIKKILRKGEKVLWKGKPLSGIRFQIADLYMIPLGLAFLLLSVLAECSMGGMNFHEIVLVQLVSIFYFCFALALIGRFFLEARQRENTFYCLTTERAIIGTGLLDRKSIAIELLQTSQIELFEKLDGSGGINFGPAPVKDVQYRAFGRSAYFRPGAGKPPAFELIPDVQSVYQKVQKVQRGDF